MKYIYRTAAYICAAALSISALQVVCAADESAAPSVSSECAILIEPNTKSVIFEKNSSSPHAPASITKTMTMLLTIEALENDKISLDDEVTASENACQMGGTEIWLEPGEKMSVKDLLKSVAVSSANDAAVALAEHIGGSEEKFVEMMNSRAKKLGVKNTVFKNSHGLDEDGHISCAYDIAIISAELMKHEMTQDFTTIWMDELRGGDTQLVNTNRLIRFYKGATGVKTGTTDNAGFCLSASAERNGMSLIAVVLGAKDNDSRFEDAKALLNYGFQNYTFAPLPEAEELPKPIPVKFGQSEFVEVVPSPPEGVLIKNELKGTLQLSFTCESELTAPVKENQQIGKATVTSNGDIICTYPLNAKNSVSQMNIPHAFLMFLKSVISL